MKANTKNILITALVTALFVSGIAYIINLRAEVEYLEDYALIPPAESFEEVFPEIVEEIEEVEETIIEEETTDEWTSFSSEMHNFEISYPSHWTFSDITSENNSWNGIIARMVNPKRAGLPDTDIPIEQVIISPLEDGLTCESYLSSEYIPTDWEVGFGFTHYKYVCLKTMTGTYISVSLSAQDEESMQIMDKIAASFALIK